MSSVAQKLQLRPNTRVAREGGETAWYEPLPDGAVWSEDAEGADAALIAVVTTDDLARRLPVLQSRGARDALTWLVYPKKGTVRGSDLTRDVIWRRLQDTGVRPVSQVAVTDTWSALRIRAGDDRVADPR